MKLGAIILAAGGSSRMGSPKGLCQVDGVPLLRAHLDAFSPLDFSVVVLGAEATRLREAVPPGIRVVENRSWRTDTMSDSLRRALYECSILDGCLVTPVDVPPAAPSTLDALLAAPGSCVPVDPSGRDGHPVRLDSTAIIRLREGPVEGGLRALLRDAPRVPVPQWDLGLDFDDPPALAAWLAERLTRRSGRAT